MEVRMTDAVPIYTDKGEQVDELKLPEKFMPIPTKRGGFGRSGIYYKGSGIVYTNHLGNEPIPQEKVTVKAIGRTGIVYEKYLLCYPMLVGKHGIFTFRHQEIFTDCEGGCGKKEQKILENQKIFERTAIEEIVDVIPIGIPEHYIYGYRLKPVKGGIDVTLDLIQYVLENNWNTAWDKNLWSDILGFGYVRDVADWFQSGELNHKIGTVYALLNSLYRDDITLYAQLLLRSVGLYSFEKNKMLYYSALIVKKYCPKQTENLNLEEWDTMCYERLFMLLVSGKACCHLEDEEKWRWVREYYIKSFGIWKSF
jgi:hypothetical protein